MYKQELAQIKKLVSANLWELLADQGCMIAGGALTSVFTNKPVNDIDVYFPSQEAFTKVVTEIYGRSEHTIVTDFGDAHVLHVTKKALLLQSEQQDVQLIGYQFYKNATEIFDAFDFSINMAALCMKTEEFSMKNTFMKHNAQKYLHFNPKTTYPLISALRVNKYRERGYTISKSQMLRVLLAINLKQIDSWEKLIDELGGMYGTPPEEIFDTTKPFDLVYAMEALDNFEIKDTIIANRPTIDDVILTMSDSFVPEFIEKRKAYFNDRNWRKNPYESNMNDKISTKKTGACKDDAFEFDY